MNVTIRKFEESDIEKKVKWINDSKNNRFLHYDLPLEVENTRKWFKSIVSREDRYDAVIEADGVACGLIGLLTIDRKNKKAEYYIALGEQEYKGKGVSLQASRVLLNYAFKDLGLNRVYLYTESKNKIAQAFFEKVGFIKEGFLKDDLYCRGEFIDRIVYGISRSNFYKRTMGSQNATCIEKIGAYQDNCLYIKRDDLLPFSFGGNKARKAALFFQDIDKKEATCVVTYGSASSNHCRIISNEAARRSMKCYIVSPEEVQKSTFNKHLMNLLGAKIIYCPIEEVSNTIEKVMEDLKKDGENPYFIQGGGHGNLGTEAYVRCYEEIKEYERINDIHFDYIFHASGTGTTQAGLICGKLLHGDGKRIIGISIARKEAYGKPIIIESVKEYLKTENISIEENVIEESCNFCDSYIEGGYSKSNEQIHQIIHKTFIKYGIPLDLTYTGKAFWGMEQFLKINNIKDKNILFIHTGGTPLFFDYLNSEVE